MTTLSSGDKLYNFFVSLKIDDALPNAVHSLTPYSNAEVLRVNRLFYDTFYNDNKPRTLLFGINPGRFGAGITGINFTDPVTLENSLFIPNDFDKKSELSATYIHQMINSYGSPKLFFGDFFLTAVSPLGFVQNGNNINYYDDKELQKSLTPFIKDCIKKQFEMTGGIKVCGCIGQGKNLKFLKELNTELKLFKKIVPLPHPRWIMQYRRKELDSQIENYISILKSLKEWA